MKHSKSPWLAVGLGLVFLAGLTNVQAADDENPKKNPKSKQKAPAKKPTTTGARPGQTNNPANPATRPGEYGQPGHAVTGPPPKVDNARPVQQRSADGKLQMEVSKKTDGTVHTKHFAADGKTVQQEVLKKTDGTEQTTHFSAVGTPQKKIITKPDGTQDTTQYSLAGRAEKEVEKKPDGTQRTTVYDLGREKRAEVVHKDGTKENTEVQYNRNGEVRARETVKLDAQGRPVSKTVVVKNNLAVNNTTVMKNTTIINNNVTVVNNNTTVVREYRPRRYGYVYVPPPIIFAPVLYTRWYDPYWYAPSGVAITTHGFTFAWGWGGDPWYAYHRAYWQPYPVYVTPSYWVTDWMVAGYLADRYAVVDSVEQTRKEIALARDEAEKAKETAQKAMEEAEKAKMAAQQARDEAEKAKLLAQQSAFESELAEARRLQNDADARANKAEMRAAKAEMAETRQKEMAASGKPNPNATPIDEGTKTALREQVERTIAEKKVFAEQSAKGGAPVLPDVSQALADPKHIYPVSKTTSVILAKDSGPAGTLTEGDLLKVEPGQDFKDASETTFVTMRVMTSKGEEGEVPAGTLISVPLRDLQEFDNEFRAKLDQGLAEADKNKDRFKQSAPKS